MSASKNLVSQAAKTAEDRLDRALDLIAAERERMGIAPAHTQSNGNRVTLLTGNLGDVAALVSKGVMTVPRRAALRGQLIRLAAQAVAWAEVLDDSERTQEAK